MTEQTKPTVQELHDMYVKHLHERTPQENDGLLDECTDQERAQVIIMVHDTMKESKQLQQTYPEAWEQLKLYITSYRIQEAAAGDEKAVEGKQAEVSETEESSAEKQKE